MVILNRYVNNDKIIYTFFECGKIIIYPTKWLRFLLKEPRYAPTSVDQYARNLLYQLRFFREEPEYADLSIDQILLTCQRIDIQNYINFQRGEGKFASTIHNREASNKEFFDWMTSEKGLRVLSDKNHPYKTGKLISNKPLSKRPKFFTKEEMIILLCGLLNESERCLLHFLYDTGLRISEATNLRKSDFPDERLFPDGLKYYPLLVRGVKGRGGETKERVTILSSPVLARVRRYHNSLEYKFSPDYMLDNATKPVFLSATGKKLSNRNINKQIKNAAIRSGLVPERYSVHKLRHSAAYSLLSSELGNDFFDRLLLVQQTFGHAQISTTEIYASIPPAILAKITKNKHVCEKYDEAKEIYERTFLPPLSHHEKRGHTRN